MSLVDPHGNPIRKKREAPRIVWAEDIFEVSILSAPQPTGDGQEGPSDRVTVSIDFGTPTPVSLHILPEVALKLAQGIRDAATLILAVPPGGGGGEAAPN